MYSTYVCRLTATLAKSSDLGAAVGWKAQMALQSSVKVPRVILHLGKETEAITSLSDSCSRDLGG